MTKISKILTQSGITVVLEGEAAPFSMSREHRMFGKLIKAINKKDIIEVKKVIKLSQSLSEYTKNTLVRVENGVVYVGNESLDGVIADRILEMYHQNIDFTFMANFVVNLMENPSYQSRQELYLFLENGNMPITDDGRFLAYKWVRDDYKDAHSGKFDNSVGARPKMARHNVDDNRQNTCSNGLHVCTHAYTRFSTRLMLVAVNPKDVVSVPYDYNNAKMRVSEYEVIEELPTDQYEKFEDDCLVKHLPERDANGRFMKRGV